MENGNAGSPGRGTSSMAPCLKYTSQDQEVKREGRELLSDGMAGSVKRINGKLCGEGPAGLRKWLKS